jgi:hypothetical protein
MICLSFQSSSISYICKQIACHFCHLHDPNPATSAFDLDSSACNGADPYTLFITPKNRSAACAIVSSISNMRKPNKKRSVILAFIFHGEPTQQQMIRFFVKFS